MLGLPQTIDINVVHCYSHLEENFMCMTYDVLGVQSTGTLEVCLFCAHSKTKRLQ